MTIPVRMRVDTWRLRLLAAPTRGQTDSRSESRTFRRSDRPKNESTALRLRQQPTHIVDGAPKKRQRRRLRNLEAVQPLKVGVNVPSGRFAVVDALDRCLGDARDVAAEENVGLGSTRVVNLVAFALAGARLRLLRLLVDVRQAPAIQLDGSESSFDCKKPIFTSGKQRFSLAYHRRQEASSRTRL